MFIPSPATALVGAVFGVAFIITPGVRNVFPLSIPLFWSMYQVSRIR
jgi:hypothetical protein